MRNLKKRILDTLIYYDLFSYPLKEEEIKRFLGGDFEKEKKARVLREKNFFSPQKFRKSLAALLKEKKIKKKKGFYFLFGKDKLVNLRIKRKKISRKKIKIIEKTTSFFKALPWVKMLALTGGVAMENAKKGDDIDLLIVCQHQRLWLTRFILNLALLFMGKKRKTGAKKTKEKENKLCLNLFIDEKKLCINAVKQNFFVAHEICQLKPLFNKDYTYERFLKANHWVKNYLPNSWQELKKSFIKKNKEKIKKIGKEKRSFYAKIIFTFFNYLEKLAYYLQLGYMKKKITNERISLYFAFFHPKDRSKEILTKYKKRMEVWGK